MFGVFRFFITIYKNEVPYVIILLEIKIEEIKPKLLIMQ